jgi:NTP pyrophosphatase (non-canonical NTP hydrolase)
MKNYIIFRRTGRKAYLTGEIIDMDSTNIAIDIDGIRNALFISEESIGEALITSSPVKIVSQEFGGWLKITYMGLPLIGKSLNDIVIGYPSTLKGSAYVSENNKSEETVMQEPTMLPYALIEEIHDTAVKKGFWDKPRNEGELLMLVVSELSEALEALRNNAPRARIDDYKAAIDADGQPHAFKQFIKGSVDEEIADAVIRLFDLAVGLSVDLPEVIKAKMLYNETRERMHGKKF